jgi:spore coat polysaccharide biosynthesis protein SpsF
VSRRLVAALACRNDGSRLFGKPLQQLSNGVTILDQIIAGIRTCPEIEAIVLGVSEGTVNEVFVGIARAHGIGHIVGDSRDVLARLVQCGRAGGATDVFRVTTECPWFAYDMVAEAWRRHLANGNDITVTDELPEGLNFEIYTLEALERAHRRGTDRDRSEFCSNYPRTHPEEFKAQVLLPADGLRRLDLRVTVDQPQDLILARAIAAEFPDRMPRVMPHCIVEFLDRRPDLCTLVNPFVDPKPVWGMFANRSEASR